MTLFSTNKPFAPVSRQIGTTLKTGLGDGPFLLGVDDQHTDAGVWGGNVLVGAGSSEVVLKLKAQKGEGFAGLLPNEGAIFANASGKDEGIQPAKAG